MHSIVVGRRPRSRVRVQPNAASRLSTGHETDRNARGPMLRPVPQPNGLRHIGAAPSFPAKPRSHGPSAVPPEWFGDPSRCRGAMRHAAAETRPPLHLLSGPAGDPDPEYENGRCSRSQDPQTPPPKISRGRAPRCSRCRVRIVADRRPGAEGRLLPLARRRSPRRRTGAGHPLA